MFEEINLIGFESSKRIGKMILQTRSLKIELADEEIMIPMFSKNRNDYFYLDYIENQVNNFRFVCHIVKANGIEKDVISSIFLKDEKDLNILKAYIDQLKSEQNVITKKEEYQSIQSIRNNKGMRWLSKQRDRM